MTVNKTNFGSLQQSIPANQSTTSTSYTDLATVGPQVSVNVPASGKVLVLYSAQSTNTNGQISPALTGSNTVAASDDYTGFDGGSAQIIQNFHLFTGLTPGLTTFTLKYKCGGASTGFLRRQMFVMPIT